MRAAKFVSLGVVPGILLLALPAFAQDMAAAEALFREGKALLDKGDVEAACPKLSESQRLDPSSGTLLNLAACHERQGRVATAWAEYLAAARMAQAQGKPERVKEATERATALEPRLSHLTVRLTSAVPGVIIHRGDVQLEASAVGSRIPVDPGVHRIRVEAPGYEAVSLDVTVGQAGDAQTLVVPELRPAAAPEGAETKPTDGETKPVTKPTTEGKVETKRDQGSASGGAAWLPWAIGGVGVAALGVGGFFAIQSSGTYDDAKKLCGGRTTNCSGDAMSKRGDAETEANVANVVMGVGVVAVSASAVWLLLADGSGTPEKQTAGRWAVGASVGPGAASASVETRF